MEMLKEYSEKFGVKAVTNDMGELRESRERSIIFPNGWVASIVDAHYSENAKYSVAVCDYNGYFDWEILNEYGADKGRILCNTELEVLIACETIRKLSTQKKKKEMSTIEKIWIFEIQDGVSGGFIIADTEVKAIKKLSLDRGVEVSKDIAEIYPLTSLDLNKDVHDLW